MPEKGLGCGYELAILAAMIAIMVVAMILVLVFWPDTLDKLLGTTNTKINWRGH